MSDLRMIQVKAKPQSKISKVIEGKADEPWLVYLKASPVDGKANKELIETLSKHLRLPKSAISIKTGQSSPFKRIVIQSKK